MEVFGFQQSMTHCSEFFGSLSQHLYGFNELVCFYQFQLVPRAVVRARLCPTASPPSKMEDTQRLGTSGFGH